MYNGIIAYGCCDGARFEVDFEIDKITFYNRDGVMIEQANASEYASKSHNPLNCFDPAYTYMRQLDREGRL